MLTGRSVAELERDYAAVLERVRDLPKDVAAKVRAYEEFVRKRSHHLSRHPSALLALAHAQPLDSPVLADARRRFNGGPDRPWLRRLHPPEADQNPSLRRTINVGAGVNAVAFVDIGGGATCPCRLQRRRSPFVEPDDRRARTGVQKLHGRDMGRGDHGGGASRLRVGRWDRARLGPDPGPLLYRPPRPYRLGGVGGGDGGGPGRLRVE